MKSVIVTLIFAGTLAAQSTGIINQNGALSALPPTCSPGQLFLATDQSGATFLQGCKTTNTYQAVGGSSVPNGTATGQVYVTGANPYAITTNPATIVNGVLQLEPAGTASSIVLTNGTSGTITLQPVTGALGTVTASFPANTGTVAVSSAYPAVTDGVPISWNLGSAAVTNGIVTLAHTTATRPLNLTNLVNGGFYTLLIKQDSTGGALMTLGTGCTWKVFNGGAGAIVLTASANATDLMTFTYDGTNCWTSVLNNGN